MYIFSSVMRLLDAVLAPLLSITGSAPALCRAVWVALLLFDGLFPVLASHSCQGASPPGVPWGHFSGGAASGPHPQVKPRGGREQGTFADGAAQPYSGWRNLCGHPLFGPALVSYPLFFS